MVDVHSEGFPAIKIEPKTSASSTREISELALLAIASHGGANQKFVVGETYKVYLVGTPALGYEVVHTPSKRVLFAPMSGVLYVKYA